MARPTRADLLAAYGRAIPDVVSTGLRVLFCGINPGLYSAATGCHFARPGNRFWPALYRGGFTPRLMVASEQTSLLSYGLGITNLVARGTARADELTPDELRAGVAQLATLVESCRPAWVAVLGLGAYRTGFGRPRATVGPRPESLAGAKLWVLPNPSGLNAHYTLDALADAFRDLNAVSLNAVSQPPTE